MKDKVLTKELQEKILKHLEDVDLFEDALREPRNILKESLGKKLGKWDADILKGVVDDRDVYDEISEITEKEKKGNIFDED